MKKWHVFLAAAVVVAVVAVLLWRADAICHVPRHRDALKIGFAAGCFEFWINRYQSAWSAMIGAAAALFAAVMAWRAIHKQIELAKEQSEESRRMSARHEVEALESTIRSLSEYERRVRIYHSEFPRLLAEDGKFTMLRLARSIPHLEFVGLSIPAGTLSVTRAMEVAQQIRALPTSVSSAMHSFDSGQASAEALGDLARADERCALLIRELDYVATQLLVDREMLGGRLQHARMRAA